MKCKICGAEMADNMKFCSNCGNPVEETQDAIADAIPAEETIADSTKPIPEPETAPENLVEPSSAEQPYVQNTEPQAVPYVNPAIPNEAVNPGAAMPNNGMSYNPAMNPIPPVGVQPPKKKKKVGLIILLCLIPVVIIIAIVAALIVYGFSLGKNAAESAEEYWKAYVECDADAMADMVPEDYWTYISDTYELSKEEAVTGMQLYLDEKSEALGGGLTYEWNYTGVQAASGSSSDLDEVREVVGAYGLELNKGIGISVEAKVSGSTDSEDYNFDMWTVKIDGEWYNVSAMTDFDDICEAGYGNNAKYVAEYGDIVDTYWNGFSQGDGAALAELVPPNYWDFIDELYGCTREDAEGYLNQYLVENMGDTFGGDSNLTISATITGVEEYETSEMDDMNSGLEEYGLAGDAMLDVNTDLHLVYDDQETDDTSYVTLTNLNGEWYVYDLMYYFADACGTYSDGTSGLE